MRHVKLYEDFSDIEKIEEGAVRKFLTGHNDKDELNKSKEKILSEIEEKVEKLVSSDRIKKDDSDKYKEKLKKQAERNNWKGKVSIRKSPKGEYFVAYDNGTSSLQDLGKAASSGIK